MDVELNGSIHDNQGEIEMPGSNSKDHRSHDQRDADRQDCQGQLDALQGKSPKRIGRVQIQFPLDPTL